MANVEKISISLPHDMVEDIRGAVESGAYATTSEVLRDAVRDWQKKHVVDRHERLRVTSVAQLRRMVRQGIESAERGEVKPAEQVFRRVKAKYAAMARAGKKGSGKKASA